MAELGMGGSSGGGAGSASGQGAIQAKVGALQSALQSLKVVINNLRQEGIGSGLIFEALSQKIGQLLQAQKGLTTELEQQKIKFKDNAEQLKVYTDLQGKLQTNINGTVGAIKSLTKEQIDNSKRAQKASNETAQKQQDAANQRKQRELSLEDVVIARYKREQALNEKVRLAFEEAEKQKAQIAKLNADEIEKREVAKFKRIVAAQKQEEAESKRASKAKIEADLKAIRSGEGSARKRLDAEIKYLKEVQQRYKQGSAEFEKLQGRIAEAQGKSRDASFRGGFLSGLQGPGLGKALGSLTGIGGAIQGLKKVFGLLSSAITGSFKAAVNFEAQLAQLQAVTGINNQELNRLKKNVLDVAGSTKFTSEEIVQLQTELGKLGFSVTEIEAATLAVARTAQALGEKVGPVAQRIGQILNQFNLSAAETSRVSDSLVSVINSSALSFEGFSTALQYIGPLGAEVGTTFEETAVAMALLADNGFTASRIGTGLRGILTELSKTGKDLNTVIEGLAEQELTLAEAVDLVGKRNAAQLITLVKTAKAQQEIGGTLSDLTNEYFDTGSAAIAAAQQVDTFQGNLDLLKSAVNRVQISFGNLLKTSRLLRLALRFIDEEGYNAALSAEAIASADPVLFSKGMTEAAEAVGKLKGNLAATADVQKVAEEQAAKLLKNAILEPQKAILDSAKERIELLEEEQKNLIDIEIVNAKAAGDAERVTKLEAARTAQNILANAKSADALREVNKLRKAAGDVQAEIDEKQLVITKKITEAKEQQIAAQKIINIATDEEVKAQEKAIALLIMEAGLNNALEAERKKVSKEREADLKRLQNLRDNELDSLKKANDFNVEVQVEYEEVQSKIEELLAEQEKRKENGKELTGEELLLFDAKLEQYKKEESSLANLLVQKGELEKLAQKEFEKEFKQLANRIEDRKLELENKQALLDIEIKTQENLSKNAATEEKRKEATEEFARLNAQRTQNEVDAFNDLNEITDEYKTLIGRVGTEIERAGLDGRFIEKAEERLKSFRLSFKGLDLDYSDLAKQTNELALSLSRTYKDTLDKGLDLSDSEKSDISQKAAELTRSFLQQTTGLEFPEVFLPEQFDELKAKIEAQLMSVLIPDPDKTKEDRQKRVKKLMSMVLEELVEAAKAYNDVALENTKNRLDAELEAIRNRYKTEEDILKSQLDNQLITESQFRTKKEELRKKELQQQNEINKAIFDAEKKADLNNVAIDAFEAIASNIINNMGNLTTPEAVRQSAFGYAAIVAGAAAKADAIRRRKFFPVQFEEGGFVQGPSHSQGGVPFTVQGQGGYEMEGGEFIVNKKAAAFHRSLLERINGSYKPNPSLQPLQFAEGGLIQKPSSATINVDTSVAESVHYLRAIAEATTTSAIQSSKPVRAYVTERDLRTSDTARQLKDRNTRI